MRPFLAAIKHVPDEARALAGAIILVVIGVGMFAPMVAIATPTKTPPPKITVAVVKTQDRMFVGDPVAHFGISELYCRLTCNPINERIDPMKVRVIYYRKDDPAAHPKPKQQAKRKAGE